MHYSHIAKSAARFQFSDLSEASQTIARANVIAHAKKRLHDNILEARAKIKESGIDKTINQRGRIRKLLTSARNIENMQSSKRYLDKLINGNLLEFLIDGTYITYFS